MELYYKDLISKDSSLEKLVDDLMLIVQGGEEFAQANGTSLEPGQKEELHTRLQQLELSFGRFRQHAIDSARAADKLMRRYPYSTAGVAFAIGLLAAGCFRRRR